MFVPLSQPSSSCFPCYYCKSHYDSKDLHQNLLHSTFETPAILQRPLSDSGPPVLLVRDKQGTIICYCSPPHLPPCEEIFPTPCSLFIHLHEKQSDTWYMPVSQQLLPEFSDIHVVHVPSTLQLLQQPNTPLQNPSSSSPSEESVAIATQPSPEATPLSCIDLGEGGEYTSSVLSQRFPLPTQDPVTWRNSQSGHFSTMSSAHNTPTLTSSDSEPVASLRYIPGASAIPPTNPSTLPLNQPYPSIQFASASSTPS